MERVKKKYSDLSLRKAFVLTVLITFCIVVVLSGLSIWGCLKFRRYLLPDSNEVMLTLDITTTDGEIVTLGCRVRIGEETPLPLMFAEDESGPIIENYDLSSIETSVTKVENSYNMLTPKRKIAYQGCGILMIVLPAVFSMAGILFCGFFFYRQKLNKPLKLLSEATEQIADKNLDFKLSYASGDEMGHLCRSFEQMRQALDENNRELWKMIEERKMVQASIAHDLRNPIAIIEGYAEYLQMNLQTGNLTMERILQIADNMDKSAKRLEQYTESIRAINQLDDIEINRKQIPIEKLLEDISEDLSFMAAGEEIKLNRVGETPKGFVSIDTSVLYRVLENILNNALRYAKETITLSFEMENRFLTISVTDDGVGFSEEILKNKSRLLTPAANEDGHCGLGLTISRLLCKKHDGRLELSNHPSGGAIVKIIVKV
ncbi:MAG: HAMP domain-containing histidine kinase [Lachnospiraceae bacterium]|nr:HAMP domain-containing histidine kinase [Lachnospiraceae bacterium]